MKNKLLLSLLIILASCGKDNVCQDVEYDKNVSMEVGDEICFPDGNSLTFTQIEHQFCPCGAVCVWAGDLSITFTISDSEEITNQKIFYPTRLSLDPSIFSDHTINFISYLYDSESEEVPECAEDFDSKKITLTLSISQN